MQSNQSYILLFFCIFYLQIGFSQSKDEKKDTITQDSIKPKEALEDIISHTASGYTQQNAKKNLLTLYDKAHITYTDIDLKAGIIIIDSKKKTLFAKGIQDSTGYNQRPVFKQGNEESEQDSVLYHIESKRAIIYGMNSKQGELFVFGKKTKRVNDSTIYVSKIQFTTSEKKNPDYVIKTGKAKIIPGEKIIVGPSNLVIADVPTPLGVPFAYFPTTANSVSGFLIPAFDTGSTSRGIGFQNGGYYFAINDYMDLTVLGDLYSNGTWGIRASSNYKKRYRFNGSFSLSLENLVQGIKGFDSYGESSNFNVRWSHSRDAKANPNSSFSASVNFGSSQYFRQSLNQINIANTLTNTTSSSINFSKTFVGTPFTMNATATHSQNLNTGNITMTFPSLTVNMNRVYPFAGKGGIKKNPVQKLGFNYAMQGEYQINTTENLFFKPEMFATAKSGLQHTTGTNTNIKVLKHFTLSPSVSYREVWNFDYIKKQYNPTTNTVETNKENGFKAFREYSTGVSLTTAIYGLFKFKKGRLKAIRHVMRPSISYNYRPDFASQYEQQVQNGEDPTQFETYSPFENGLYGRPGAGVSNSIGISINNTLEAKIAPKDPDSDEEDKKIKLLNNLNFSTSYNMTADSLRWAPVSFSTGIRLLKEKLNINLRGSMDVYQVNDKGQRIDKINPGLFRMTNASLTANYSLSSKDFGEKNDKKNNTSSSANTDVLRSEINPDNNNRNSNQNTETEEIETKLYQATIPWSVNFSYSTNYSNNGVRPAEIGIHSLSFSGDIELSPKWLIGYASGYDIKAGAFTFSRFNIQRKLDSWRFNFNWVPFGRNTSYTFSIGVKSGILSDLKYDKNKVPDRRLF